MNWFQRPGQPPEENVPADPRWHRDDTNAIAQIRMKTGLFDREAFVTCDPDVAKSGLECAFVPETLCQYRVHGTSMLHKQTNPNAGLLILERPIRHPWLEHS